MPSPSSSRPEPRGAVGASAAPSPSLQATAALHAGDAFQAAALLLVDPLGLGGVLLHGSAGPVRDAWLALLQALSPPGMPLARLPASASEDRLLGGLDLSATLAAGRPVAQAGLLTQADGGIVLAAMAERMPAVNAAHLCSALDRGELRLERDGLTQQTPARIAVVALDESQGDDRPPSAALADRLGLWVDLAGLSLRDVVPPDSAMAQEVAQARARLPGVTVPDDLIQALCAATLALGVDSPRAAWAAVRCTGASAALRGEAVACDREAEGRPGRNNAVVGFGQVVGRDEGGCGIEAANELRRPAAIGQP